jgi:hypothetical protein
MKGKTKHRNCRIKYIYNVHVNLARRKLRHPGKKHLLFKWQPPYMKNKLLFILSQRHGNILITIAIKTEDNNCGGR